VAYAEALAELARTDRLDEPPALVITARARLENLRAIAHAHFREATNARQAADAARDVRSAATSLWARLTGRQVVADRAVGDAEIAESSSHALWRHAAISVSEAERALNKQEAIWAAQRTEQRRVAEQRLGLVAACFAIFRDKPLLRQGGFNALAAEVARQAAPEGRKLRPESKRQDSHAQTSRPSPRRRPKGPRL
jgi:hypothetical protein